MATRIQVNITKVVALTILFVTLMFNSCMAQSVNGQGSVKSDKKNIGIMKSRTEPIYRGFTISFDAPRYTINSNIDAISDLPVNYLGGMAGVALGDPIGKVRAGIGYYTANNSPYSFDLLTQQINVSFYPMRIVDMQYHTFEPYLFSGLSGMKNRFYGYYLSENTVTNYSTTEMPYQGYVKSTQLLIGTGIEYQLENYNNDFVHLYLEVAYGTSVREVTNKSALQGTSIPSSLWITMGISFGKVK